MVDTTNATASSEPLSPRGEASAPVTEIEVTAEMVEAGVNAYYENARWGWENPGNKQLAEMVAEIFRAMFRHL